MTKGTAKIPILMPITADNGLLKKVEKSWRGQYERAEMNPDLLYGEKWEYAAQIANEAPADPRYGVYALCWTDPAKLNPRAPYDAIAHVNIRQRGTSNAETRVIWHQYAPNHVLDRDLAVFARVFAGLVNGTMILSSAQISRIKAKIYLEHQSDRDFADFFVAGAKLMGHDDLSWKLQGGWLHMEKRLTLGAKKP